MKHRALVLALVVGVLCHSFAGTRVLTFIHQPLTTFGTEQNPAVVVARIPILTNAVPESIIAHIASPNKLIQDSSAQIADSNLLSLLGVNISAQFVAGRHYRVTLDIREMGSSDRYGVTAAEVISATIKCLRLTFDEDSNLGSYELHIKTAVGDKTDWSAYEGRYESRKTP